jgi:hypothetical protein
MPEFNPLETPPRSYGEALRTYLTIQALDKPVPGLNRKQRRILQKRMRGMLGPYQRLLAAQQAAKPPE